MPRLMILDALGLAYRAHYAFIRRPLRNSRGENTSAIFAFTNTVLKLRRDEQPDYWALAWDGPGPTFRHERYADYKATRKPMPDDLFAQLPALEDVAQAVGLPVLELPGIEADDVMATLARRGAADGFDVDLVTSDKDLAQLVDDRVRLMSPTARAEEYVRSGREEVVARWGVPPERIRDLFGLMGDTSDNVPGVPGVGEKTAVELIARFGTLEALYEHLDDVPRETLRERLRTHRDLAFLSRELVTVKTDCDIPSGWEELRCGPIRRDALLAIARRFELQRIERIAEELGVPDTEAGAAPLGRTADRRGTASESGSRGVRLASAPAPSSAPAPPSVPAVRPAPAPAAPPALPAIPARPIAPAAPVAEQGTLELWGPGESAPPPPPAPVAPAREPGGNGVAPLPRSAALAEIEDSDELRALIEDLHAVRARAIHGLGLATAGEGDPRRGRLIGLALAARDGTTCYLPLAHAGGPRIPLERVREWLGPVLADPSVPKVAGDLKSAWHRLGAVGLRLEGLALDLHVASFLCDASREHDLDALARDMLGLELPPLAPPRGRARVGLADLPVAHTAAAARRRAGALFPLAEMLRAQLESRGQWSLYETLEHPLIVVLGEMEREGIAVDAGVLAEMSRAAGTEIARLEGEIHTLAGGPFNVNSGPQLARVLFETLGLKAGRRTKSGHSTDQAVLEELAASHPLPARVLEHRALSKLKATYLDAIPAAIDPADGRVHTTFHQAGAATGRLSSSSPNLQNVPMRTAQGRAIRRAFVARPGACLVGADYSQIELRIMAHLSEDPQLIAAFTRREDVHESTARQIFGVHEGALAPELRGRAKVVNFGVMYGMGARSLSGQMGIGLKEAQAFIAEYFALYAGVRRFLEATVAEGRRRGYVETVLGRRRYLPGLASTRDAERAFAERAAINAPIQGSAADLMKLAMIRVRAALLRTHPSARLLLQVHDELLLECAERDAVDVSRIVRDEMETCFPMRVPLEVSVGRGATWFDVH